MEKIEIVRKMVDLQILCLRYVERNTSYRLNGKNFYSLNRILMKNKLRCTYQDAVKNLEECIETYCNDCEYLVETVKQLKKDVISAELCELRFGENFHQDFTDEEIKLDRAMILEQLEMTANMVEIKKAADYLNINPETIKKAAQENRIMNTKKVGATWQVYIPECMEYWNIKKNKED